MVTAVITKLGDQIAEGEAATLQPDFIVIMESYGAHAADVQVSSREGWDLCTSRGGWP